MVRAELQMAWLRVEGMPYIQPTCKELRTVFSFFLFSFCFNIVFKISNFQCKIIKHAKTQERMVHYQDRKRQTVNREKLTLLLCFSFNSYTAITLTTLLTPDVQGFSLWQEMCDIRWESYSLTQFWHYLTGVSVRSHRWRAQFHETCHSSDVNHK